MKNDQEIIKTLPTTDIIILNDRLDKIILQWLEKEFSLMNNNKTTNTKLSELTVFNMKLIYNNNEQTLKLLNFMFNEHDGNGDQTLLHSRLQDLYIFICMTFPNEFIEYINYHHINTISLLGYSLDEDILNKIPYGWLFFKIQYMIRYEFFK